MRIEMWLGEKLVFFENVLNFVEVSRPIENLHATYRPNNIYENMLNSDLLRKECVTLVQNV